MSAADIINYNIYKQLLWMLPLSNLQIKVLSVVNNYIMVRLKNKHIHISNFQTKNIHYITNYITYWLFNE